MPEENFAICSHLQNFYPQIFKIFPIYEYIHDNYGDLGNNKFRKTLLHVKVALGLVKIFSRNKTVAPIAIRYTFLIDSY